MTDQPASLAEALIALQADLPQVAKTDKAAVPSKEGLRRTKYANLHNITEAAFPQLAALGLYYTCVPKIDVDVRYLECTLAHVQGESLVAQWPLPREGSAQQLGSAITYGRRYAFCAMTGIAPAEDDDDAQADARAQADRQAQRTRYIAEEKAIGNIQRDPARAERRKGPLPADEWTREPAQDMP